MKQLTCEMCGSTDLMKQDGVFVCQSCGTKYSVEEAKKMMVEGNVTNNIDANVVNIINDNKMPDYEIKDGVLVGYHGVRADVTIPEDVVIIGSQAFANNSRIESVSLPKNLECIRNSAFYNCTSLTSIVIPENTKTIEECAFYHCTSLQNVTLPDSQKIDIDDSAFLLTGFLLPFEYGGYKMGTDELSITKIETGTNDFQRGWLAGSVNSAGGVDLLMSFKNNSGATINKIEFCVKAKNSIGEYVQGRYNNFIEVSGYTNGPIEPNAYRKDIHWECLWYNNAIKAADIVFAILTMASGEKIYIPGSKIVIDRNTEESNTSGGCYVATAVYGSYDCPQVWTLRRFRDYTLAETWYGRAFIRTYYAISPTLVKWFGHTDWFKKLWKGRLDRMVANLNAEGVEDTPYKDRNW